ncbi:MAG: aminotransferase class III-fold pyridoxal phosphate-dependent enzyme [Hyphomicrobiaceae bacterium]|nr:MAG: aminotransferase class III-fold pyridoxal phosphate-dependent enzyme [Hyphomicrobiaceae bacterium]
MRPLSNFAARDVETLLHPTTNLLAHRSLGPLVVERAEGVYVYDTAGKRYIEGLAGLWCTGLGYGNQELVETAREQMSRLSFTHLFGGRSHEPAIALAEKIKAMAPAPTSKVFFTNSGSEANDTQIKIAWYFNNARGQPKRKKIISRHRAYHGTTIATASLSGLAVFHADFDLPMARVLHTDCPHHWRSAEPGESEEDYASRLARNLEELIEREGPETIAAFIAEPVMGAGGVIMPPKTYFEEIQAVLSRHGIALIADEVICGFARTGNWWGSQTYGIRPDTVTMAKAITSAYVPLGGLTISEDVYQALLEESGKHGVFAHGFTYSGHPLACAVALKTIEIYERINIVAHVRRVAPIFALRLNALADHPLVGDARSVGLLGALELVKNKRSKENFDPKLGVGGRVARFAEEEGLICRAVGGDNIGLCPPLIIDGAEINAMFDMMGRALDKAEAWLRSEGQFGA